MHMHMHIHIHMSSDFRVERRQVVLVCWMQNSKMGSLRHHIASRLNAHSRTDWTIEDQTKNLNSTARPYDAWAFSPLDFTADWLSHLALAIYMFVIVNFEALAQASDSKLGSLRHQIASRLNVHSQTDWAIEDQAKNLNSTARRYDDWLSHLALAIYMRILVNFDALAQASKFRIERRQVVFLNVANCSDFISSC